MSDCIFEIHQLRQSGFSRVYSNSCCSCFFEPGIIKIGQSSHEIYSNNILNFQESMINLNARTKKVWKLIVCTSCIYIYNIFINIMYYIYIYIYIYQNYFLNIVYGRISSDASGISVILWEVDWISYFSFFLFLEYGVTFVLLHINIIQIFPRFPSS